MISSELVLSKWAPLMTVVCDERIVFELGAQAGWQVPTIFRKEVQLIVHMPRPLSDQRLRVDRTAVVLNFQHIAPKCRMSVTGVNGGMNCCLPSGDTGSSSTRNRITPHTPMIPAGKSKTCTTLAEPIPPQVAVMLRGVTSTGTRP